MDAKDMILYEDRDLIVCHKPAGLAVQSAGIGSRDMMSILMNYLSEQNAQKNQAAGSGLPYLGMIHRLDQPVEGILVFAKNKKTAAELSAQVTDGRMKKKYLAVCCKEIENPAEGIHLVNYLKKDARTNTSAIVPENTPGAKRSELIYRELQSKEIGGKQYVLTEITLLTGRHHQIRVQMAGNKMPLYGDQKYNRSWEAWRVEEWEEGSRTSLALCSFSLEFRHPGKKKNVSFTTVPKAHIFESMNN